MKKINLKFNQKITFLILISLLGVIVGFGAYQKLIINKKPPMTFFVTSKNPGNGADLGSLAGADAYCDSLANKQNSAKITWKAYLSNNSPRVNARERIGKGPWHNSKGDLIATDLMMLHGENNLNKSTALDENGNQIMGRGDKTNLHDILTGSTPEGNFDQNNQADSTCADWTSNDTGSATVGHHDRVGRDESAPMKSWNSAHATRGCSNEALKSTGGGGLFYCFGILEDK